MATMVLCAVWPKTFTDKRSLSDHMRYHKQGTFTCEVCETKFTSRKKFENHVNSHKEGGNQCGECGKYFGKASNLSIHSRLHKSTLTCPYCIKIFSRKDRLQIH